MVASATSWVKFFQAAGIPSSTSATYAHIFHENRMDFDMLIDLNKEYIREMGISPMGDIIAILRHAKKVHEQNTRDRVLSSGDKQSVATLSVSPIVTLPPVKSTSAVTLRSEVRSQQSLSNNDQPASKQARRVLPEHEGKYKITLPSGSTERSKEILAKKAMLYSDKPEEKRGIFDRLDMPKAKVESIIKEPLIHITGVRKPVTSIFSRLGGKNESDELTDDQSISFAGILKNAPKKTISIKKPLNKQKIVLVRKIPAKACTMVADEYESERMDTGEKTVSFSTEDEILEIESRHMVTRVNRSRIKRNALKGRLGLRQGQQQGTQGASLLHQKRRIKLRNRLRSDSVLKSSNLRSDHILAKKSIKSRLNLKRALKIEPEVKQLVNQIGRVSLGSRLGGTQTTNGSSSSSSSVFDRLGFNNK